MDKKAGDNKYYVKSVSANSFFESQLPVNQRMVTVGADYTFGLGNGLGVAVEHMWVEGANISALNVNYPVNMENSLRLDVIQCLEGWRSL
ncbi:hypothetical protein MASR1M46_16040 [Bacteroidales bacterium]